MDSGTGILAMGQKILAWWSRGFWDWATFTSKRDPYLRQAGLPSVGMTT
jgi:hypothetical protein